MQDIPTSRFIDVIVRIAWVVDNSWELIFMARPDTIYRFGLVDCWKLLFRAIFPQFSTRVVCYVSLLGFTLHTGAYKIIGSANIIYRFGFVALWKLLFRAIFPQCSTGVVCGISLVGCVSHTGSSI